MGRYQMIKISPLCSSDSTLITSTARIPTSRRTVRCRVRGEIVSPGWMNGNQSSAPIVTSARKSGAMNPDFPKSRDRTTSLCRWMVSIIPDEAARSTCRLAAPRACGHAYSPATAGSVSLSWPKADCTRAATEPPAILMCASTGALGPPKNDPAAATTNENPHRREERVQQIDDRPSSYPAGEDIIGHDHPAGGIVRDRRDGRFNQWHAEAQQVVPRFVVEAIEPLRTPGQIAAGGSSGDALVD